MYHRPVRSFVRRQGRITPSQRAGLELLSKYGLSLDDDGFHKLTQLAKPIVLEIGFGMGEGLFAQAKANPELTFIGIEVHQPGVGRLLNEVAQNELENLFVFTDDAKDVLEKVIPNQNLHRVQVFFPDPWPKKKHHKRRIISPKFVALVSQKLKHDGILHIATDWQDYYESIVEVMAQQKAFNPAPQQISQQLITGRPRSRFEQRGIRLGHQIYDLVFQNAPLI